MAEFGNEVQAKLQGFRDRNARLTQEGRQQIGQAAGQLAERTQEKIGFKQAAAQINQLGRATIPDWVDRTWGQVANEGADVILQGITIQQQRNDLGARGGQENIIGAGGEKTQQTIPQMSRQVETLDKISDVKLRLSTKFDNLSNNLFAQEILGELDNTPLADLADKTIEVTNKYQAFNEFDLTGKSMKENGAEIGFNFDTTPYFDMYRENPVEATSKMESDYIDQLSIKSAEIYASEGRVNGIEELTKLAKDPYANQVLGGLSQLKDNPYWAGKFSRDLLKPEYVTPENILIITNMATDLKNKSLGTEKIIGDYDKTISAREKDISNIIKMGKNNAKLSDKDFAILDGLSTGSYMFDGSENIIDSASKEKVKSDNTQYLKNEYDKMIKHLSDIKTAERNKEVKQKELKLIRSNAIAGFADTSPDLIRSYGGLGYSPQNADEYKDIGTGELATPEGEIDTSAVVDINTFSVSPDGVVAPQANVETPDITFDFTDTGVRSKSQAEGKKQYINQKRIDTLRAIKIKKPFEKGEDLYTVGESGEKLNKAQIQGEIATLEAEIGGSDATTMSAEQFISLINDNKIQLEVAERAKDKVKLNLSTKAFYNKIADKNGGKLTESAKRKIRKEYGILITDGGK